MLDISVLYVEDDRNTQDELYGFLQLLCKEVYVASDGIEGLKLYDSYNIDIVITDIKMAHMDGVSMCEEIRKINEDQDIIIISAFNDTQYLFQAIALQVEGFIQKPTDLFLLQQLLEKIAKRIDYKKQSLQKLKEFETIVETTKDGIALTDLHGNFLFCNEGFQEISLYTLDQLRSMQCSSLVTKRDQLTIKNIFLEVIKNSFVKNIELTCINKNGNLHRVSLGLNLMPDKQRILIFARDVTEFIKSDYFMKDYVSLVDENVITSSTDLKGNITYVSDAFCKVSGYSKQELLGINHRIVRHPDMSDFIYKQMWKKLTNNQTWIGEIKNLKKNGDFYWVKASISPIFNEVGEKIGYTAIRQDITDKKIIEEISITDGLTGIYNRRHFNEIFPKVINSAKRNNELVSFLIMDIDHFKQYNDTYGHQMGDTVLIEVAKAIKDSLHRADDYCFRLGGEEFGVIFKSDTKQKSIDFANIIRQNIENLQIRHEKNSASEYITASMGLVCKYAQEIINDDTTYKEADDLLYKAKESGRNRVISN